MIDLVSVDRLDLFVSASELASELIGQALTHKNASNQKVHYLVAGEILVQRR